MSGKSKKPGLNLADLAPMSEDVPIGDNFITVHGISARDGLRVFQRFPRVIGLMNGGSFDITAFLSVAPEAVAAIIATSTGHADDEQAEENAGRLGIEAQFDILEAIGRLTFTKGFAPFMTRIMALADAVPSAPSTKVTAMRSPPASEPSSQAVIPPM